MFNGKNGKRIAHFKGTDKIKQAVEYKDGKLNGFWEEYYITGKLRLRKHFVNDTLQDTSFYYHENGALSDFQIFKKGSKEGCWKRFNPKGVLYSEINFLNDEMCGIRCTYSYNSGKLLERATYKYGHKEGFQELFYKDGSPKCNFYLSSAKMCEGLKEWTEKGKLINNDFKIFVKEENKLALENKLHYEIRLENPQDEDEVLEVEENEKPVCNIGHPVTFIKDHFEMEVEVSPGYFVMEKRRIAAFRKTAMGNTFVKTSTFTVSSTNF